MSKNKKIDPRVKRTTRYLRDALIELLEERDLNTISVQNITDKAELTRGTFYLHYQDKQDFLLKSMDETLEELIERVKPKEINGTIQEVNEHNPPLSFLRLFEYIAENHDFFKVMLGDRGLPEFRRRMLQIVQEKVYGDLLSSIVESDEELGIPKEIFTSYITSAHIGVISTWLENGMKHSPAFMAALLTKLTLQGPMRVIGLENKIRLPK
ncbi:TetR/AcrR family transcriptional regulator [Bacillus thuringiensis]|jgi:AcrR family transcriptional regulator|uniref:TetR/AcrR family transcriptional regulator n=1 Tax=Bacillus thuringiensis TaxID=1428 RepID=UPI001580D049|nr:TetR/AcrR family transcriptional regulator [Bacillus thuringiensis]NUH88085.1 TetR/AcrR family transcriptional regulator [Bacillus thuringiensis]NUH94691.1 TetR/AcrR family transcriptional regulator [Bacillus thuringiensis]NUH99437.1 TetR/AcrR family transcriptional regulator [Bacillus thuringiensis]NUI04211.1 TetR/AcrR family transcriptional regulator [Bacillus thuringiensis]NUI11995.1 TetR/AcrR family transcriptional regulator [Bacillus thuringiensis]